MPAPEPADAAQPAPGPGASSGASTSASKDDKKPAKGGDQPPRWAGAFRGHKDYGPAHPPNGNGGGPPKWPNTQYNLGRLKALTRPGLQRDLWAGLGVAAYAVPQVMAYATLAGVDPVAGLWAALAPMAIYAVVGTSRLLSVGPESTTAIMTAAALAPLVTGDAAQYAALASLCAIVVGAICSVAALLRVGFVAQLLSRPVLIGYLAGVAVIMIAGQLGKLFGVSIDADEPLRQILETIQKAGVANLATTALGIGVVVSLFVGSHFWPRLPWPLLVVMGATVLTTWLNLEQYGVKVVGTVPEGLPPLSIPTDFSKIIPVLGASVGISIVAFTDNVLTARAFAAPGEEVDADSELRALGLANFGAGLTSGFPVSSSGSRTALARASRAASPGYGLIAVAAIVAVLLFAGPVLADFPMAALGGLVVYAAYRIVEFSEFRWLWNFRRLEFYLGIATFLAVLILDLLAGVAFAIVLSGVTVLARVARPHAATLGLVEGMAGMHDTDEYTAKEIPGLMVFRYDSPLFFANAEDFRMRVMTEVAQREHDGVEVREVLLNCEANVDADSTAVAAMGNLFRDLKSRGIVVCLARVHVELFELLERAGIVELVGRDAIFPTLPTAVAAYHARFDDPAPEANQ